MTSSDLYDEATGGPGHELFDSLRREIEALRAERDRLREINQEVRRILYRVRDALSVEAIEDLPGAAQSACDERERLRRERDAWRAATGLSNLTPREAGDKIDSDDAERDRLRQALVSALQAAPHDCLAVLRAIHGALGDNQ